MGSGEWETRQRAGCVPRGNRHLVLLKPSVPDSGSCLVAEDPHMFGHETEFTVTAQAVDICDGEVNYRAKKKKKIVRDNLCRTLHLPLLA